MKAGRMNQPVTLLLKTTSRDAMGGEVIAWVSQGEIMAEVTPLAGREFFDARQVNPEYSVRFFIRYHDAPTITSGWRLLWRGGQYDILDVHDIEARQRTWEIMTRTAPN